MQSSAYDYEHLIVAYDYADNFAGIFITYSDEDYSSSELLDYFGDMSPNYLIVAEIPDVEGLTPDNYITRLENLIDDLRHNDTSSLGIKYYIPNTLH
jgi:hypothetical protein